MTGLSRALCSIQGATLGFLDHGLREFLVCLQDSLWEISGQGKGFLQAQLYEYLLATVWELRLGVSDQDKYFSCLVTPDLQLNMDHQDLS